MCGLTDLDWFDTRKSHINVYLASQKKVSKKMLSETKEHCTFYTNTNKALTFSNCLQIFTSDSLLLTGTKQNHCFEIYIYLFFHCSFFLENCFDYIYHVGRWVLKKEVNNKTR